MKSKQLEAVAAWDVLVVDADPGVGKLIQQQGIAAGQVRTATSIDQANAAMLSKPADVMLVNIQINDQSTGESGGGVGLIRALRAKYPHTEMIAVSKVRRSEVCIDAWRAGAADMLIAPLQAADVERSFNGIAERRAHVEKLTKRNGRLRQVCKQLNRARHEISQQVDLLCNDLVKAYQEMAQQLNTTQLTTEYCQALADEIEVEGLLRKTMEWILKKVGPINAAVYLPDADRRFALGAYLNLDTEADAALISDVGETIVKQADAIRTIVAIDNDKMLEDLFGHSAARLKTRSWLALGCFSGRECLGVIVVFRNREQAMDNSVRGILEVMAPILGEKMEEALSLYNRMNPFEEDEDSYLP
jgi:response regulator of citrate/malate metabolism